MQKWAWRHLDVTHVPLVIQALFAMCWLKKWMLTSIECVFSWLLGCEGTGAIFMVCACAVGLRGNGLPGMRGTWGDNWRSAHVPTIPFTWLRRANALGPTAHAFNYQALLSLKLCEECRFNSCVRVFFIPMGSRGLKQWVVTSISHMVEMRDSDWSRSNLLRSDWLLPSVASMTTSVLISFWTNGMCLDRYVHWVSKYMHLTQLMQADSVISTWIINEFENFT